MQKNDLIAGRVLAANGKELVCARGANLFHSIDEGKSWVFLLSLPVGRWRKLAMRVQLLARLFRLGVHHLAEVDGKTVVIANKESFVIENGKVTPLGALFGSRPMALCAAEGRVYYGEYRSNSERSAVHIYGLDFQARVWRPVWVFEGVRHVHGVFYDPYERTFWVTTGDSDEEAAIWRSDDHFQSLTKVIGGSQQVRAVQLLFTPEYVFFGSDAPNEANHIYRMNRSGTKLEKLAAVGGSVFYGCKVGDRLYFSTAVEPSKINNRRMAEVWQSPDGVKWDKLFEFPKDRLSMKYFQYGQVLFPNICNSEEQVLYCTPFATEFHGKTLMQPLKDK